MSPNNTTPGITDTDHQPIARDEYAAYLQRKLDTAVAEDDSRPGPKLSQAEGLVIAELLDVLAAVYPGEDLGRFARATAVRLYDRMGI